MYKVAVVNRTNLLNFGSVLQVLALAEAVKKLGYDAEVIWEGGSVTKNLDLRPNKIFSILLKLLRYPRFVKGVIDDFKYVKNMEYSVQSKEAFQKFVENHFKRKFYTPKEMKRIGQENVYHRFICGSDQIWSSTTLYPDPLMYLRFVEKSKRVAYAPSLGRSYIPNYNKKTLRKFISDIPHVSVRELDGASLIKDLIEKDVPVVLDPTLLFDSEFWKQYEIPVNDKDYVVSYFLNEPSESVQKEIIKFANGRKIIALKSPHRYITENYHNVYFPETGPGEFLSYIDNADFVFTDSYHGMLFSINFSKEFLSVERNYGKFDQSTRQKSILSLLGITNHYNSTGKVSDSTLDYNQVQHRLNELRITSYQYLKEALQ